MFFEGDLNPISFRLVDIIEEKKVIDLPRDKPNWKRIVIFGSFCGLCCSSLIYLIRSQTNVFYADIITIILTSLSLFGILIGTYVVMNEIYKQPILVLTPSNLYLGLKTIFRPVKVVHSGILPRYDLQLVIVRDSHSQRFRLILEGRQLVELGIYNTREEVEEHRIHLRTLLAAFYPQIYISTPIFHEV